MLNQILTLVLVIGLWACGSNPPPPPPPAPPPPTPAAPEPDPNDARIIDPNENPSKTAAETAETPAKPE